MEAFLFWHFSTQSVHAPATAVVSHFVSVFAHHTLLPAVCSARFSRSCFFVSALQAQEATVELQTGTRRHEVTMETEQEHANQCTPSMIVFAGQGGNTGAADCDEGQLLLTKTVQECAYVFTPYMIVFASEISNAGDADCEEAPVANDEYGARMCSRVHAMHDCV